MAYLQTRLRARSPTTVAKERNIVVGFFRCAVNQGYLLASPARDPTRVKAAGDRPLFRSVSEIEAGLALGGLTRDEQWALWDCVYLTLSEIAELFELVRVTAWPDGLFILHAVSAYTGIRRGELLRLLWSDLEFRRGIALRKDRPQAMWPNRASSP